MLAYRSISCSHVFTFANDSYEKEEEKGERRERRKGGGKRRRRREERGRIKEREWEEGGERRVVKYHSR